MPFSGIQAGSELEKKIDRCVVRVMSRQGTDKSKAIAICRAAIPKASKRTKSKSDAIKKANYRNAGPSSTKLCTTCKFNNNGRCTIFDFKFSQNHICDRWLPNIEALRNRGRQLTAETKAATGSPSSIMAHGPGGLYSTLGSGKKRTRKEIAISMVALKRSRGGAEQRAMFAKMGASGSLQGKGADGKRTGAKIGTSSNQRERQEMQKFLDSIGNESGGIENKILPPKGKAPPGQGREYQTRRWIHGRIRGFEERKNKLRESSSRGRGTRRDQQRQSRNSIAIDSINQSLDVARHVIKNLIDAGENFTDSRELFNELFTMPAALLGGM